MNISIQALQKAFRARKVKTPEILYDCSGNQALYDEYRQVFNRNFQFKPLAIVLCETKEQVSVAVTFTREQGLPLRVRSGGHDHEGESSGTDVVLLDLRKMNKVHIDPEYARIQPGIRFQDLTTALAEKDVMIPHGTCATVCIAGFALGGGWGPWTRKYGMCCESILAATMVLGDGSIREVHAGDGQDEKGLLWAIRGGGGFSYGIITEFKIKTFPLPPEMRKFSVEWNKFDPYNTEKDTFELADNIPTIVILEAWENVIAATDPVSNRLVGTNLKVAAKYALRGDPFNMYTVSHNCTMYGYWEGNEISLQAFVAEKFATTGQYTLKVEDPAGANYNAKKTKGKKVRPMYGANLMGSWDRFSSHQFSVMGDAPQGTPLPPDYDQPAPHKITSRLVNPEGLGNSGHEQLLRSLTSSLILPGNKRLGLFSYITLGAITGHFYQQVITPEEKRKSAFPYKENLYTIQYQTWWNETDQEKAKGTNNEVYSRVNRALDWMDVCRNYRIPNTSGAFISFKDSGVPTRTYFDKSYTDLVAVKIKHAKDPDNHFRSRKTII